MDFLQLMMKAHNFKDEDTPEEEKVVVDMKRELTDDEVVAMVINRIINVAIVTPAMKNTTVFISCLVSGRRGRKH